MCRWAKRLAQFAVGDRNAVLGNNPVATNGIKNHAAVRKKNRHTTRLVPEQLLEPIWPNVIGEGIERLVVERGHHFSHGRNSRAGEWIGNAHHLGTPDFLRSRFDSARKAFPRHRQTLVGPRHIDWQRGAAQMAIAHNPSVYRESTAMFVAYLHRHRPLRPTRFSPKTAQYFSSLQDLDKNPPAIVTGADDCLKITPWLCGQSFCRQHKRAFDGVAISCRIDHLNRAYSLDARPSADSRNLKHRSVDTGGQCWRGDHLARDGIARNLFAEQRFACRPRLDIVGARCQHSNGSRRPSCEAPPGGLSQRTWSWCGPWAEELSLANRSRLHEFENLKLAGGGAGFAVERSRRERDGNRRGNFSRRHGLPRIGRERCLDARITSADSFFVAAGLAASVRCIGSHSIRKHRH